MYYLGICIIVIIDYKNIINDYFCINTRPHVKNKEKTLLKELILQMNGKTNIHSYTILACFKCLHFHRGKKWMLYSGCMLSYNKTYIICTWYKNKFNILNCKYMKCINLVLNSKYMKCINPVLNSKYYEMH